MITLAEYKAYRGITTTNQDHELTPILEFANEFIELFCGTKFTIQTETDRRVQAIAGKVFLPNSPIQQITEITTAAGLTPTYYLDKDIGTLELDKEYTGNLTVSYTWGYTAMPNAVKLLGFELMTHYHKREYLKSISTSTGESMVINDPVVVPVHIRSGLELYRVI